jgi:hypothetical protein
MHRSRKTDQRSHFQTVESSCRSIASAQIKETRSRCTDPGKPIKEAISKLWTVPVDRLQRSKKADQGAQITGKPIKEVISKLWTVPVDQLQRSKKADQGAQITRKLIIDISKLWTVPVDQLQRSRKPDQGAQITGKPIKEAISKLWAVPVDRLQRSKKADQGAQIKENRSHTVDSSCRSSAKIKETVRRKIGTRPRLRTNRIELCMQCTTRCTVLLSIDTLI